MMSHIDCWSTLAGMVGLTPPPHGEWKGNDGKPIYFDSIDNSAYILGKSPHSARKSWIYVNGEYLHAVRVDMGGDEKEPWLNIAWKFIWTAKDSWLGPNQDLGSIPAVYNLTMDPYEKYDMIFNGAAPMRALSTSPGKYAGEDNGWTAALFSIALTEFDKSVMKYPSIRRFPGGASDDLIPNLQHPENPVPALDPNNMPSSVGGGD
jgi:arylsulfatase